MRILLAILFTAATGLTAQSPTGQSPTRVRLDFAWKPTATAHHLDSIRPVIQRLLSAANLTITPESAKTGYRLEVVVESAEALVGKYTGRGSCYSGAAVEGVLNLVTPAGQKVWQPFAFRISPPQVVANCGSAPREAPFHHATISAVLGPLGQALRSGFGDRIAAQYWTAALMDRDIQLTAVQAVETVKDPMLVPPLIKLLVPGSPADAARRALVALGEPAVPQLIDALATCLPAFDFDCKMERATCCVRAEVAGTLTAITGQKFGENRDAWVKWARGRGLLPRRLQ
jgi:hypothetical protein